MTWWYVGGGCMAVLAVVVLAIVRVGAEAERESRMSGTWTRGRRGL